MLPISDWHGAFGADIDAGLRSKPKVARRATHKDFKMFPIDYGLLRKPKLPAGQRIWIFKMFPIDMDFQNVSYRYGFSKCFLLMTACSASLKLPAGQRIWIFKMLPISDWHGAFGADIDNVML